MPRRPGPLALVLFALALLLLPSSRADAAVTSAERKLAARVERHVPRYLEVLERAVNQNSGTMNLAGVKAVGDLFSGEFQDLGFKTRWVDGAPFKRAGHLIAERGPAKAPKVVLVGHLDTVFESDSPFQKYQRLDDSTARGPGVTDMKGGNVVMLTALRSLRDEGLLNQLRVVVVLIGDEEQVGTPVEAARADYLQAADGAIAAIGFEDGDGDPRHVVVSRRGSSRWLLHVRGTPSHSSQVFSTDVGAGAIYEASRILQAFRDSLAMEPYLTYNPGLILGGSDVTHDPDGTRGTAFGKDNIVADSAIVSGDLRALSLEQRARAVATMERIVAATSPNTWATIAFRHTYPPLAPSDGNRRLLAMFDDVSRGLGLGALEAVDPARAGAADVSFLAGRVPMVVDALGMKGSGGHTVNETARLQTLGWQAKRVAVVLARLSREKARPR